MDISSWFQRVVSSIGFETAEASSSPDTQPHGNITHGRNHGAGKEESQKHAPAEDRAKADRSAKPEDGPGPASGSGDAAVGEEDEEDEELKNETCGFCKFMKKGPCRAAFTAWSKCVDDAKEKNEDFVDKCFEQTKALRFCMEENPDYYAPVMMDEEADAMQAEVMKDGPGEGEAAEAK